MRVICCLPNVLFLLSCVTQGHNEVGAPIAQPSAAPYPPQRIDSKNLQEAMVTRLYEGLKSAEIILIARDRPLPNRLCHASGFAAGAVFFGLQLEGFDWKAIVARVNNKLQASGFRTYADYGEMISTQVEAWGKCAAEYPPK